MPLPCLELDEQVEAIEARREDRRHAVDELQRTGHHDRCGRVEDALELLVRCRANDDVRHPGLVLERQEHMSLRRLGMLLHDDRATDADELAVPSLVDIDRRYHTATIKLLA